MKRRKRKTANTQQAYESLEPKQLLAALIQGTSDADVVRVEHVDETTVSYTINEAESISLDVTDGLLINLQGGVDEVYLDDAILADLVIVNTEHLYLDEGDNQWRVGATVDPTNANAFVSAGTINDNIAFLGATRLNGGSGNDVFNINSLNLRSISAKGGDGDDLFRFAGNSLNGLGSPTASGFGEAGNDRFVYFGDAVATTFGQTGFDIVDYRQSNYQTQAIVSFDGADPTQDNEKVFASASHGGYAFAASIKDANAKYSWVVDGNVATLTDVELGRSVELENFNVFHGSNYGFDRFWVLNTAQDIEIKDADWIQISSDLDASKGNLKTINHDIAIVKAPGFRSNFGDLITLSGDRDGTLNPKVIISDFTSDGTFGLVDTGFSIRGLTGGKILFRNDLLNTVVDPMIVNPSIVFTTVDYEDPNLIGFQPEIIIHGSRDGSDVFVVEGTWAPTTIYAHGGDDVFMIGSTIAAANGDLRQLDATLDLRAGEGVDRMYANNQSFDSGQISYLLTPTGLAQRRVFTIANSVSFQNEVNVPFFPQGPSSFERISFNNSMEVVRVHGSKTHLSKFQVTPSRDTVFAVDGVLQTEGADELQISRSFVGGLSKTGLDGSYKFEDGLKSVYFFGIEDTPELVSPLTPMFIPAGDEVTIF